MKHLQVHLTVKIKLIRGNRPVKITDTDVNVPSTCGLRSGMSPQSRPGTLPKL